MTMTTTHRVEARRRDGDSFAGFGFYGSAKDCEEHAEHLRREIGEAYLFRVVRWSL